MTPTERSSLNQLLKQQDPDLLDWFLGKSTPADSSIADVVRHVLTFSDERKRENGLESVAGSVCAAHAVSTGGRNR